MKRWLLAIAVCGIVFGMVAGCEKSDTSVTPTATSKAVYILNGLASSLSVIDLNTDAVSNNVVTLGKWPNQVVYYSGKLFVVNSGSNNVQVFNADTYALMGTIDLGANNNPMTIAILNDGKAYVACSQSNSVIVVNPTAYTVTKTVPAGVATTGVTIANNKAYAMNAAWSYTESGMTYGQGTVTVINTATDAVSSTINVQTNPQLAAIAPDGKLHVVCTGDYATATGKVCVIDPTTDVVVKTIDVGGSPGNIAVSSANVGYCGTFGTGLITYNAQTYAIKDSCTKPLLGKAGSGTVFDLAGNVYIADFSNNQVVKLDATHATKKTYDVGQGPQSLAVK